MSLTTTFRRQHDALELLAAELAQLGAELKSEEQAQDCARIIGKMTGILTIHLAAEDRSLYPRMIGSKDEIAAQTARRFAKEMGGLAATYGEYEAKWRSGAEITGGIAEFRAETGMILHALGNRIKRENEELYPLADSVAAKPLVAKCL